jgi:hypothetical protein
MSSFTRFLGISKISHCTTVVILKYLAKDLRLSNNHFDIKIYSY